MPELPEVNTVMKLFREHCLNKKVIQVMVKDDLILRNSSEDEFKKLITGNKFVNTYRQGKYFFGLLENDYSVLFHLGMTGDPVYYFKNQEAPSHERFSIRFEDGTILGYNDPRKFSNIRVLQDYQSYLQEIKLGPDALSISKNDFIEAFEKRKSSVKGVLLNQKLIAGIGNLYADEICFQSKVHPGSNIENLDSTILKTLYTNTKKILKLAVRKNAYYQIYPEDWFWKWRKESKSTAKNRWTVKKAKIAGRTTFWVDEIQKLY